MGTMDAQKAAPCVALLSEVLDMQYLSDAFREACPDIDLRVGADLGRVEDVDVAVCWFPPHGRLAQLTNLKLVQSLAAGIDHLVADPALPRHLPLCRVVDTTMAAGMKAYVTWAVVQRQRGMQAYVASSAASEWQEQAFENPRRHRVGVAGLGHLGTACATALATIGYAVRGWSRNAKTELPEGVMAFHGADQLDEFLSGCDTLVCLLPLTPQTRHVLNRDLFTKLNRSSPMGAPVLINAGRGGLQNEKDILQCLDDGTLGGVSLDVYATEPLPADSRFWTHPKVVLTPHNAADTDPDEISKYVARQIERFEAGGALENVVDRKRGY